MTIINFEKELYSKSAIKQGLNDFRDFLEWDLKENKSVFQVDLRVVKGKPEQVKKEFTNYVLGLTKEMC